MRLDHGSWPSEFLKRAIVSSARGGGAAVQSLPRSRNTLVIGGTLKLKRPIICKRTLDCLCRVILTGEKVRAVPGLALKLFSVILRLTSSYPQIILKFNIAFSN